MGGRALNPSSTTADGFCATSSCGDVTRSGGPVMNSPKIFLDFWVGAGCSGGTGTCYEPGSVFPGTVHINDLNFEQLVYTFYSDLCTTDSNGQLSPLMQIIQQYTGATNGIFNGGNTQIGNCSLLTAPSNGVPKQWLVDTGNSNVNNFGSVVANNLPILQDSDIQNEVVAVMQHWNYSPDDNTIVLVILPAGVGVNSNGNDCNSSPTNCGAPNGWCSYHGSFGSGTAGDGPKYIYTPVTDSVSTQCNEFSSGNSPNSPIADGTINTSYHEVMEAFTNPQNAGCCTYTSGWWYHGNGVSPEIGDMCNYDFFDTQSFTNSADAFVNYADVFMQGTGFEIQTIWSNSNNGCVHDLAGPELKVQEALQPYSSSTITTPVPAGEPPFTITFQMSGELSPGTTITLPPQAGTSSVVTYWVTPNTSILTTPTGNPSTSLSGECFNMECNDQTALIGPAPAPSGGPSLANAPDVYVMYVYYHLLWEGPYLNLFTCTSGPPTCVAAPTPSVELTYVTAPVNAGNTGSLQTLSVPLDTAPTGYGIFALDGSRVSVPACTPTTTVHTLFYVTTCGAASGAATQTWATGGPSCSEIISSGSVGSTCYTASRPKSITNINYYDQFLFTASYSATDGSNPTVTLSATQFGKPITITLTSTPIPYWLDAYTEWSVPNAVFSGTMERWLTNPTSEPISGFVAPNFNVGCHGPPPQCPTTTTTTSAPYDTLSIAPQYAHQYVLTLESNPLNGGTGTFSPNIAPTNCPTNCGWENAGTTVTIQAMPNPGYTFMVWTGAGSGCSDASQCTVTMNGPVVAVANFQ